MIWMIIGLGLGYVLIIFRFLWSWQRIEIPQEKAPITQISVIIPVRNEQEYIKKTLESILVNNYPISLLEIIVVDDHSSDLTKDRVLEVESNTVKYLSLPDEQFGKKAAITHGVGIANGEYIICTDGDTVVSDGWLHSHENAFQLGHKMAFGSVKYQGEGCVVDLLSLELSSLIGIGAAMLNLGHASMINGCNYSFSKKAFEKVNGFQGNENFATGDDEFLLKKIKNKFPSEVIFLKSKKAMVMTTPVSNMNEFYQQRKRWASKWKHHKGLVSKVLPLFIFLFYSIFYLGLINIFSKDSMVATIVLFLKITADFVFIKSVRSFYHLQTAILPFLVLQIIYPFYAVFFGVASNFGKYGWKERYHQT
ncbi:MAG: glycosyltransferase [Reichenbachiella sp.]